MRLFCDNAKKYNEYHDFILWDDTNFLVYVLHSNVDQYTQAEAPVAIESFAYDVIQYIDAVVTVNEVSEFIEDPDIATLVVANGFDAEKINTYFKDLYATDLKYNKSLPSNDSAWVK